MSAEPMIGPHLLPTPPTRQTTSVCTITKHAEHRLGVTMNRIAWV